MGPLEHKLYWLGLLKGWGGWARKLASVCVIVNKKAGERAAKRAQPMIDYINLIKSYIL